MSKIRRPAGASSAITLLLFAVALSGCRTVPVEEYEALERGLDAVTADLAAADRAISERDAQIESLTAQIAGLRETLGRQRSLTSAVESDLELALRQLGALREDRLDLRDDIGELERELGRLREASVAGRAEEAAPDSAATGNGAAGAFSRVRTIGLQNDPVAARRLSGAAPGIGVDTDDVPVLYDSRLEYDRTMIYLTVVDPESRRPRLRLTVQFVSDAAPIALESAVISTEGGDPIDPIDPVVLTGSPIRQTDGKLLREALVTNTDRDLLDRLSTMISSSRIQVTFVGDLAQHTHRPSVAERAAMSNILFAFIDLGGLR